MKRILCILYVLFVSVTISAQVYTPKGSIVSDTGPVSETVLPSDYNAINKSIKQQYPSAQIMDNPTSTYNCHAYAWHMSEGGNKVWMGLFTNPTPIYWKDNSYVEVNSQANLRKVSYGMAGLSNHSAITTIQNDVFISKWGSSSLVKHNKNDCPYISSNIRYFMKNDLYILGSESVIGTQNYNILNYLVGTKTWTTSNNLHIESGQGTYKITVSGKATGEGWVKVKVTGSDFEYELSKSVVVGPYRVTGIYGRGQINANVVYPYNAEPVELANYGTVQWGSSHPSKINIHKVDNAGINVRVTVMDPTINNFILYCSFTPTGGTSHTAEFEYQIFVNSSISYSSSEGMVTIRKVGQAKDQGSSVSNYKVYNSMSGILVDQGKCDVLDATLDYSSLPSGIYILKVEVGNGVWDTYKFKR